MDSIAVSRLHTTGRTWFNPVLRKDATPLKCRPNYGQSVSPWFNKFRQNVVSWSYMLFRLVTIRLKI